LTQREQEVLTLLAKGLTIGDVARALEITPNTAGELYQVALSQARGHQPRRSDARGDPARSDPV
jgi:FixJ family two-component response regulator